MPSKRPHRRACRRRSRMPCRVRPAQIAPVGAVADQGLLAAGHALLQARSASSSTSSGNDQDSPAADARSRTCDTVLALTPGRRRDPVARQAKPVTLPKTIP